MALSRRKFAKEVKVAAIQRLDAGASVAEVARAFEVLPPGLRARAAPRIGSAKPSDSGAD
jgi:transposase-like protein